MDKAIDFIHQEISTIIKGSLERSNVSHQSAEAATNFLDKLLLLGESHNQAFSTETIIANVITMMLAGEDTTANTLAWLAYYLATYPNIQQKAQAEIEEAKKQGIDLNTLAGIESLSYLDAIIHETLRLRAAAPFLIVEATQDLDLAGIEIPAGQNIILLTRKAALNDEHFAAAKAFRPERWLKPDTENSQITPHQKKAFLPFGNGPRFCPGRYLAMIEIKALFSKVLSEYSFTLPEASEPIQEMFQFTMLPVHLSLHLNARH